MKRSEMLAGIYKELDNVAMTEQWPDQILKVIEKLGMQPPENVNTNNKWDDERIDE